MNSVAEMNVLKKKPSVSLELVTKEKALEYYAQSKGNRNIKKSRLLDYMAKMGEGRWQPGVAVIAFDVNGRLTNGHHVLTAIAKSGMAQYCTVQRGLPPESINYYDTRTSVRTPSDQMAFNFSYGKKSAVFYVAKRIMMMQSKMDYDNQHVETEGGRSVMDFIFSENDVIEWLKKDGHGDTVYQYVSYRWYDYKAQVGNNAYIFYATMYICTEGNIEYFKEFMDNMLDYKHTGKEHPCNSIREIMHRTGTRSGKNGSHMFMNVALVYLVDSVVRAWNAYCLDKPIKKYRNIDKVTLETRITVPVSMPDRKWTAGAIMPQTN